MKKTKGKVKQYENPIEALLRQISGGDSSSVNKSAKSSVDFGEYLGIKEKRGGVLHPGEEIDLRKHEEKTKESNARPYIDYSQEITQIAEISTHKENKEIEAQLKEIMIEIKKLTDSSKELQVQFKEVAIEQHVVKPGKYHKNFFSWLLSLIRTARMKVEDSGAWLAAMHSKRKSRGYNAMAKKQGTSFTQNMDRNVSTQTG